MPRRKPDGKGVVVHRIELGSYERERLDSAITARTVVGITQAAGTAVAGLGAAGVALLIGTQYAPDLWDTAKDALLTWTTLGQKGAAGLNELATPPEGGPSADEPRTICETLGLPDWLCFF